MTVAVKPFAVGLAVVLPLARDEGFEARLALRPSFCCSALPGSF